MRWLLILLLPLFALPAWSANEADLAKCREYTTAAARSQCVQLYKRNDVRVNKAKCKDSLDCWGKRYREQAETFCARAFSLRAAYSPFWAQHWNDQDFDKVRWQDKGRGVLVYYEEESSVVLQCTFYPNAPAKVKVRIGSR